MMGRQGCVAHNRKQLGLKCSIFTCKLRYTKNKIVLYEVQFNAWLLVEQLIQFRELARKDNDNDVSINLKGFDRT